MIGLDGFGLGQRRHNWASFGSEALCCYSEGVARLSSGSVCYCGSLSLGRSLKSIIGDGFSRGHTLFVLPSTFLGLDRDRLDDGGVIGNATRQRVVMIVLMGFVLVFHVRLGDGFR